MKKTIIFIILFIIILCTIFFIKKYYKNSKTGNNMSSKSADEIKDYILNINSYEAEIIVTEESNKNTNVYKIKEKCNLINEQYLQTVLEPQNISGLTMNYNNNELIIKNNKLGLEKLYQNYGYIENNTLSLAGFIEELKVDENSKSYFENEWCIIETKVSNGNKYIYSKKLYIDKTNGNPIKIEIKDITQKTIIYILYNEIKINTI